MPMPDGHRGRVDDATQSPRFRTPGRDAKARVRELLDDSDSRAGRIVGWAIMALIILSCSFDRGGNAS